MPKEWYIAKVQRGQEKALVSSLGYHGVEVYNPETLIKKAGRLKYELLFPTYIFCLAERESPQWPRVRWARGIRYFLGSEAQPTPVASSLVREIESRVQEWNSGGWVKAFRLGDPVRVVYGTVAGLDAIFQCYLAGNKRCEVLLNLVGRQHLVKLPTAAVESTKQRLLVS